MPQHGMNSVPILNKSIPVLQGYTNYQLDPKKGTYAQVPNQAPPFMGVNPNTGQYSSYAQAPAPAGASMAASQASAYAQQVGITPLYH